MANPVDGSLQPQDAQDTLIAPEDPSASQVQPDAAAVAAEQAAPARSQEELDDELFQAAFPGALSGLEQESQAILDADQANTGLLGKAGNMLMSAGLGATKSIYETYDFITDPFGDGTPEDQKTEGRRKVERAATILDRQSGVNAVTGDIAQFAAGLVGGGKIAKAGKWAIKGGKAANEARMALATSTKLAPELAKFSKTKAAIQAAVTGAIVFDPKEQRLGNLIKSLPGMENSFLAYTAAEPDDSAAEGRFKSALESIGMDIALAGFVATAMKGWKYLRAGDEQAANAAFEEAAKNYPVAPDDVGGPAFGQRDFTPQQIGTEGQAAGTLGNQPLVPGKKGRTPRVLKEGTSTTLTGKLDTSGGPTDLPSSGFPIDMGGTATDIRLPEVPPAALGSAGTATGKLAQGVEEIAKRGRGRPPNPLEMGGDATGQMGGKLDVNAETGSITWDAGPGTYEDLYGLRSASMGGDATAQFGKETTVGSPLNVVADVGNGTAVPRPAAGVANSGGAAGQRAKAPEASPAGTPRDGGTPQAGPASGERPAGGLGGEAQPFGRASKIGRNAPGEPIPKAPKFNAEQVTQIMKAHEADTAALARYGSREAAELAGHVFTPSHIKWSQINGTDELKSFLDNVMAAKAKEYAHLRGGNVITDAQVAQVATQLERLYGIDADQFIGGLARAGTEAPLMMARVESGFSIGTKALMDARKLAQQYMLGTTKAQKAEALIAAKKLLAQGGEMVNHAHSIVSNAARTTRLGFKSLGWEKRVLDSLDSMDGDRLMEVLFKAGDDPKALVKIVRPGFMTQMGNVVGHLMTNNLLWGLKTHVRNTVSNGVMLYLRPTEKLVGGSLLRLITRDGKATSMVTRQARKEIMQTHAFIADAWENAKDAWMRGDSKIMPHDPEGYNSVGHTGGQITNRPIKGVEDVVYWAQIATGATTRTMGAADEFFKTMRYKAVVTAKAAVEGEEAGLSGIDLQDFIAKRVDDSFDEIGSGLDEAAMMEARVATFTDPLENQLGQRLQGIVASSGWYRTLMPFVRTPLKSWGYGVRYTPGLQFLHKRFRADLGGANGVEAQAQAAGQIALGWTAAAMIGFYADAGIITGKGPTNSEHQQWLKSKGRTPYSILIEGENGERTYVPLSNFDQIGVMVGLIADAIDIASHPDRQDEALDVMSAVVTANAQYLSEKSNLVGLARFFGVMQDAQNKAPSFLGNIAEGLIPFSSALRQANPDPYLREARSMTDHMLDRMPGSSDKMPIKYDIFSEPQLVHKGLAQTGMWDAADVELERLMLETGKGIGTPGYDLNGEDMRDITLKDGRNAYAAYNEAIQKAGIRKFINELISTRGYDDMPDGVDGSQPGSKLWWVRTQTTKFREGVKKAFIMQHPELMSALVNRQVTATEALRRKKSGQDEHPNLLTRALDAFGMNK